MKKQGEGTKKAQLSLDGYLKRSRGRPKGSTKQAIAARKTAEANKKLEGRKKSGVASVVAAGGDSEEEGKGTKRLAGILPGVVITGFSSSRASGKGKHSARVGVKFVGEEVNSSVKAEAPVVAKGNPPRFENSEEEEDFDLMGCVDSDEEEEDDCDGETFEDDDDSEKDSEDGDGSSSEFVPFLKRCVAGGRKARRGMTYNSWRHPSKFAKLKEAIVMARKLGGVDKVVSEVPRSTL